MIKIYMSYKLYYFVLDYTGTILFTGLYNITKLNIYIWKYCCDLSTLVFTDCEDRMGPKANSKSSKGGKQNGNKSNGGRSQSQDTHAGKEHNGESNIDYSLLRKSIQINPYGAGQIAKAYHSGSAEVHEYYTCCIN